MPQNRLADFQSQSRSLSLGQPNYAPYSQSQSGLRKYLQSMRKKWVFDKLVVITSRQTNADYPLKFIDPVLQEMGFIISFTKEFSNPNIQVNEYTIR